MGITILDIILLLAAFGFLALGFAQGVVKLLFVIVGFYLALVVAALISNPFAIWLGRSLKVEHPTSPTYQLVMFLIVLLFLSILIIASLFASFRYMRLPTSLQALDQVGGLLLGAVAGLFVLTLMMTFIKAVSNFVSPTDLESIPVIGFMLHDIDKSSVGKIFLNFTSLVRLLLAPVPNSGNLLLFAGSSGQLELARQGSFAGFVN